MPRHARRRARRPLRTAFVLLSALAVIALLGAWWWEPAPELTFSGPEDGALLGAAALSDAEFAVETNRPDALAQATLELNGQVVTSDAVQEDRRLAFVPGELADGAHELRLVVPGRFPHRERTHVWQFTTDATPPSLEVAEPHVVAAGNESLVVNGTVEDGAELSADGGTAEANGGEFTVEYASPPGKAVTVVATDEAGNTSEAEITMTVVPSRVRVDEMRGVHVSMWGWASPELREPVMELVDEGRINTIQLDIKDESGMVSYDSQVPLAKEMGASAEAFDLAEAVQELHDRGVQIVGRIVAFRDPVFAEYAWDNGMHDMVLQTPGGEPYAGYGGFTNFAHPDVRQYNIDLALEAAAAGVDDILWDYVRRPDGPVENLVVEGLEGTPEESIAEFVAMADDQLEPFEVGHGASLYGIAASRPTQIGQDVPMIAEHVDYVAPMLYPSHWGPGEFDVPDPNEQPGVIIDRSLAEFQEGVKGTDARVVPWLQDFDWPVDYSTADVRAQLDATYDRGINEWLMWNAAVRYTPDAYDPR